MSKAQLLRQEEYSGAHTCERCGEVEFPSSLGRFYHTEDDCIRFLSVTLEALKEDFLEFKFKFGDSDD